jgi:hypothetical protein
LDLSLWSSFWGSSYGFGILLFTPNKQLGISEEKSLIFPKFSLLFPLRDTNKHTLLFTSLLICKEIKKGGELSYDLFVDATGRLENIGRRFGRLVRDEPNTT